MPTSINITGLQFYGFHGVPEAERQIGHRYVVDLHLEVEETASQTDSIGDTVDYALVMSRVLEIGGGESCRTVERLAAKLGEAVLRDHPRVDAVTVNLRKQLPPAPFIVEEVGVCLRASR